MKVPEPVSNPAVWDFLLILHIAPYFLTMWNTDPIRKWKKVESFRVNAKYIFGRDKTGCSQFIHKLRVYTPGENWLFENLLKV